MLSTIKLRSHLLVGLSVVIVALLALVGFVGERSYPEKIEQLHVVVSGAGENGVRITETIDQDFGSASRHGPQLVVPNDFGVPTNVTASSPDAPDDLDVAPAPFDSPVQGTRIRVGDPNVTVTGQHRYVISYVLPTARFSAPTFSLDAVGADSAIPIEDITVVFSGISLEDPTCAAGAAGAAEGSCRFEPGAPLRVEVDRLDPYEGITVSGEVTAWGPGEPVEAPAIPERRTTHRLRTAGIAALLGAITAAATYVAAARTGANEVLGSSPAEAAHGVPGPGPGTTRKVSDAELAEMTTVEFAPPRGIAPWQGRAVLEETLDESTVTAWFSGAIADDVLAIDQHGGHPRLSRGPKAGAADAETSRILHKLFANREVVDLDGYDSQFGSAWTEVEKLQDIWIAKSGWWWGKVPTRNRLKPGGCLVLAVLAVTVVPFVLVAVFLLGLFGVFGGPVSLVVMAVGFPGVVARVAYAPLRPGRTANGSAYALQVASFRRFLVESEGQYVDWAWKNGLLRQYSAWAVALDAADAWREAMERAGVPPAEIESGSPMMVHSMAGSFRSSHTAPAPASSSGGSSGGFSSGSSGSVGGGGGGGSHGSW